jgi:hypothetical protein
VKCHQRDGSEGAALFSHAQHRELDTGARLEAVSAPQNRDGSGRWPKGVSGNPGGRPKGQAELSKSARTLVGEGGEALIQIWWSIANDPMRRDADRLRASELLADRGWGKAPAFAAIEEADPLGLEDAERAAEEFRARIMRLADRTESDEA